MNEEKNLELEIEKLKTDYAVLATTMNLNQQNIIEKLNELVNEFKEIRQYMDSKLDDRIDQRIQLNEGKKAVAQRKWLLLTVLSSGGLSALVSWIAHVIS